MCRRPRPKPVAAWSSFLGRGHWWPLPGLCSHCPESCRQEAELFSFCQLLSQSPLPLHSILNSGVVGGLDQLHGCIGKILDTRLEAGSRGIERAGPTDRKPCRHLQHLVGVGGGRFAIPSDSTMRQALDRIPLATLGLADGVEYIFC